MPPTSPGDPAYLSQYNALMTACRQPPAVSGDFDGEGKADVLALYDYGNAAAGLWVFPGTTGTTDGATAPYRVWHTAPGNFDVGRAKVTAGDFNGDGKTDAMALYDYGNAAAGLLVLPGTAGTADGATAAYRVWYTAPGNFDVGRAKVTAGDFNGDGKTDAMVLYDYGNGAAGLLVFPGTGGTNEGATAPYRVWYTGPGTFDVARAKLTAGDFNGDGKADAMVLYDYGNASAGLLVFPGTTGTTDGATAPYRVWHTAPGNFDLGRAKVTAGDFNGDGKTDAMVLYDYGNASAGLLVLPGTAGTADGATAAYRVWYTAPGHFDVGRARVTAGDFNGDGKTDAMVLYDYGNASAGLLMLPGTAGTTEGDTALYRAWYTAPGNFDANRAVVP